MFIEDIGCWFSIISIPSTSTATDLKEDKQILTEDESGSGVVGWGGEVQVDTAKVSGQQEAEVTEGAFRALRIHNEELADSQASSLTIENLKQSLGRMW